MPNKRVAGALVAALAVLIAGPVGAIAAESGDGAQSSSARQQSICNSEAVTGSERSASRERLPPIAAQDLTEAQRAAAKSISAGPRGCVFGPFSVLLRSPELLERTQQLGEFLRFRSVVPIRLRELAILFCGREWEQPYVWFVHEPIARKEGLTPEVIAALAEARQPPNLTDDEQVVYEFSRQLLRTRKVTDQTFQQVKARFGEDGVVELAALHGYFALLAMEMNVARTPLPPEATKPFRDVND